MGSYCEGSKTSLSVPSTLERQGAIISLSMLPFSAQKTRGSLAHAVIMMRVKFKNK